MSTDTTPEAPTPSASPEPSVNPFARLGGIIFSPIETLSSIVRKPDWVIPFLAILAISIAAGFLVTPKLDIEPQLRAQYSKRGASEEQIQKGIEIAEKIAKYQPYIAAVAVPFVLLVVSGTLFLAIKVFGGEGRFTQAFSITVYGWVPQLLKGVIIAAILYPRGRIDVRQVATLLKSNLGFLSDPTSAPAAFTFLSSMDVFTFWTLFLLIVGLSKMSGFSRMKTAYLIVPIWLIVLAARVGLAALQGG